ncbi:tRNA (adenosine(37)-N6)-threonylcarbamoyltransferase complex ATPase subunit type 1 TsaE [Nocardioides sp. MAHUQ-72]|uniref:tRNA (adenosine(37)-N6)-threonylcarbamoyltransferase complex ATPase subunit type 1 TsaE n=1 Tax=unclassified Nocardioides TaxID=2615069 RepID=UPI00361162E7
MTLEIRRVGPEEAEAVRAVVLPAFEARPRLDPPAAALSESLTELAALLANGAGGLVARFRGEDVGVLVLDPKGSTMYLRRFAVLPSAQGHGIAKVLIDAAVEAAHGYDDLTVVTREELPRTRRFWERQGFREIRRSAPNVELRRPLRTFLFDAPDAESMREIGRALAGQLTAGDLIVLSGELGAGKTTFTQGIGAGLEVRGDVTSPTFVIAREHPSLAEGPALVHVDAYRLGGIDELDDLDLETSLEESVTVVEWGEGVAEGLAESRLEVRIIRALADEDPDSDLDPRRVLMTPIGPRWYEMELPSLQREPLAEKLNENILLDFYRCDESELADLDPSIPLPLSLMVAEHAGGVVVVHNAWRDEWELPGGTIDEGETAREAAVREFVEETGVAPGEVEFVGVGTVQLGHERRIEFVAVYRTVVDGPVEFRTNDEIDELCTWDVGTELPGLSQIDAHLAELALGRPVAGGTAGDQ